MAKLGKSKAERRRRQWGRRPRPRRPGRSWRRRRTRRGRRCGRRTGRRARRRRRRSDRKGRRGFADLSRASIPGSAARNRTTRRRAAASRHKEQRASRWIDPMQERSVAWIRSALPPLLLYTDAGVPGLSIARRRTLGPRSEPACLAPGGRAVRADLRRLRGRLGRPGRCRARCLRVGVEHRRRGLAGVGVEAAERHHSAHQVVHGAVQDDSVAPLGSLPHMSWPSRYQVNRVTPSSDAPCSHHSAVSHDRTSSTAQALADVVRGQLASVARELGPDRSADALGRPAARGRFTGAGPPARRTGSGPPLASVRRRHGAERRRAEAKSNDDSDT